MRNHRSKTAATSIILPYEFLISIPLHRTTSYKLLSKLRTQERKRGRGRGREKLLLKSNDRYNFSSRESIVKIVRPIGVKDPSSLASRDRLVLVRCIESRGSRHFRVERVVIFPLTPPLFTIPGALCVLTGVLTDPVEAAWRRVVLKSRRGWH